MTEVLNVLAKLDGDSRGMERAFDDAGKAQDDLGGKTSKFSAGAAVAFGAVVASAATVAAAFKGLYEVGAVFDDMRDTIIVGTGASGDALDDLMASAEAVGTRVPASFDDVGTAVSELNTRLGLTGKPLEDMTEKMLNLARVTESDVGSTVANATRVFGDWGMTVDEQAAAMDQMFAVTQSTGIGFDSLSQKVVQFGAPLRNLGLSFEESIAMLGKWEKEGVNVDTVMAGMKIGVANLARSGEDIPTAFQGALESIAAMESGADATAKAIEVFGSRAGPDMAAAIREGRFEIDDLVASLGSVDGALDDAASRTMDLPEAWQMFKNSAMVAIEPVSSAVFDLASGAMMFLAETAADLAPMIKSGMEAVGPMFAQLGPIIGQVVPPLIDLWSQLSPLSIAFKALQPVFPVLIDAFTQIATVVGGALLTIFEAVSPVVGTLAGVMTTLVEALVPLIAPLLDIVMAFMPLIEVAGELIAAILPPLIDLFMAILVPILDLISPLLDLLIPALTFLADVISVVIGWIVEVVGDTELWTAGVEIAGDVIGAVFEWIGSTIGAVMEGIGAVIGWIADQITTQFNGIVAAVEFVGGVFESVFGAIGDFISSAFNSAIDIVRGAVNGIISLINGVIGAINDVSITIPDWVPFIGGQTFGVDIPRIPMLADGGSLLRGGLTWVGERGPELLNLPTGAVVTPQQDIGSVYGGGAPTVHIESLVLQVMPGQDAEETGEAFADAVVEELRFYYGEGDAA